MGIRDQGRRARLDGRISRDRARRDVLSLESGDRCRCKRRLGALHVQLSVRRSGKSKVDRVDDRDIRDIFRTSNNSSRANDDEKGESPSLIKRTPCSLYLWHMRESTRCGELAQLPFCRLVRFGGSGVRRTEVHRGDLNDRRS